MNVLSRSIYFLQAYLQNRYHENLLELKNKNELLNNLEILLGKTSLDSIPPWLEVDLTNACNIRCYMCYQSSHDVTYNQMHDDDLKSVLAILPYVKTVLIAGHGEQLLYQKLDYFLESAKRFLCDVQMFTNGLLVHKHLRLFGYISKLTISFDGATKEVFETQRYGANYKKVLSNILLLRKTYKNLYITLGCVVSRLNVHQIGLIVKTACELGVNAVTFPHVQHAPKIELTNDDFIVLKSQIESAVNTARDNNIVLIYNDIDYIKNVPAHGERLDHGDLINDINNESMQRKKHTPKDYVGLRNIVSSDSRLNIRIRPGFRHVRKIINRLDSKIENAEKQIRNKKLSRVSKPYCMAPWVYLDIKSNGGLRLCPYYELEAGSINMISNGLNVARLQEIRHSLLNRTGMLSVCETCPDYYHREFNYEIFKNTCSKYAVTITDEV